MSLVTADNREPCKARNPPMGLRFILTIQKSQTLNRAIHTAFRPSVPAIFQLLIYEENAFILGSQAM